MTSIYVNRLYAVSINDYHYASMNEFASVSANVHNNIGWH